MGHVLGTHAAITLHGTGTAADGRHGAIDGDGAHGGVLHGEVPCMARRLILTALIACMQMTVRDALNSALEEEMARDEKVYILGEEVGECNCQLHARACSPSTLFAGWRI